jgi:hypothetical protein
MAKNNVSAINGVKMAENKAAKSGAGNRKTNWRQLK